MQLANFLAIGQSKNADGELVFDKMSHVGLSPDDFPSEEELRGEIEQLIVAIESQTSIPKLKDEYIGPVLLMGEPVADYFSGVLLRSRESIIANDQVPRLKGFQFDSELVSMDGKIGKVIMNESVTITARPNLKSFKGVDLMGSFDIDSEGIVPVSDLTVVENGMLKCLLNNRTLTSSSQVANGYSDGPGVLDVTLKHNGSEKDLKAKLIAEAKGHGVEYGIIVRGCGLISAYKVFV
jgi:hypothetical protein